MKNLFKAKPPLELCERALKAIGINGFMSINWVNFSMYNEDAAIEILDEVRPYYFPCYRKEYLERENFRFQDYMNVLKHILRCYDIQIISKRKRTHKQGKEYYYREYRLEKLLNEESKGEMLNTKGEFVVSFS